MLRTLVKKFEDVVEMPIEIQEICQALVDMGVQDSIITTPEVMDLEDLQGTFIQYTTHAGVYTAPDLVTLIIYPENVDLASQRAVCAKELVHVCDKQSRKVRDPEVLAELANKVVGPFQPTKTDAHIDVLASLDIFAQYLAMNLLFPKAARAIAKAKLDSGEKTLGDIADWVLAPLSMVEQMLDPDWESVIETLTDI